MLIKDISLLEERDLPTLAKLLEILNKDYKLSREQVHEINIPEQFIPELDEKDKEYLERDKKVGGYRDTRMAGLSDAISYQFHYKLNSLKLLGFLDFSGNIRVLGEKFIGPYALTLKFSFTPKVLSYKSLNENFNLLPDFKSITIDDILFKDFIL